MTKTEFNALLAKGEDPFKYIDCPKDAELLAECILGEQDQNDQFWFKSETALLTSVILFVKEFCSTEEGNLDSVRRLLKTEAKKDTSLETIFFLVERNNPDEPAIKYFKTFQLASGKTATEIADKTLEAVTPFAESGEE